MEGRKCEIFSQSQNKWMKGTVTERLKRGFLRVRFGKDLEKDIHSEDKHLRLSPDDSDNADLNLNELSKILIHDQAPNKKQTGNKTLHHPKLNMKDISVGLQCTVYSESQKKWMDAVISQLLKRDHVRLRSGHDMEKDLDINDEHLKITLLHHVHNEEEEDSISVSRTMYYAEGMLVEVYDEKQGKWMEGTIIRANDDTHSVEIALHDKENEHENVDNINGVRKVIHLSGTEHGKRLRPDQSPKRSLKYTPTQSILKRVSGVRSRINRQPKDAVQIYSQSKGEWMDGIITKYLPNDDVRVQFGGNLEKEIPIGSSGLRVSPSPNKKSGYKFNPGVDSEGTEGTEGTDSIEDDSYDVNGIISEYPTANGNIRRNIESAHEEAEYGSNLWVDTEESESKRSTETETKSQSESAFSHWSDTADFNENTRISERPAEYENVRVENPVEFRNVDTLEYDVNTERVENATESRNVQRSTESTYVPWDDFKKELVVPTRVKEKRYPDRYLVQQFHPADVVLLEKLARGTPITDPLTEAEIFGSSAVATKNGNRARNPSQGTRRNTVGKIKRKSNFGRLSDLFGKTMY